MIPVYHMAVPAWILPLPAAQLQHLADRKLPVGSELWKALGVKREHLISVAEKQLPVLSHRPGRGHS